MRTDRIDDRAFFGGNRPKPRTRRFHQSPLDNRWRSILLQGGDKRLTHFQFGNGLLDIQFFIDPEGLSRCLDRPFVARGKSAQSMLDAVAQLACDFFGNIDWVLGHEIDADALRTDQANDLLNRVF